MIVDFLAIFLVPAAFTTAHDSCDGFRGVTLSQTKTAAIYNKQRRTDFTNLVVVPSKLDAACLKDQMRV